MLYDGEKWKMKNKDDTIDNLYDDKCGILMNKYEVLKEHLDEKVMTKFTRFIDKHEEIKNNVSEDIKLILYNNKKNI